MLKIFAIATLTAVISSAHAAQPTSFTLSCEGTFQLGDEQAQPTGKVGVIVDFAAAGSGTVSFSTYTIPIVLANKTDVTFEDTTKVTSPHSSVAAFGTADTLITGDVDRATESFNASMFALIAKKPVTSRWKMHCKSATRLF
ncbi:MAG TPA: hypothetical protein VGJ20_40160 [Xanthobacteraceae bacterium]